MRKVVLVLLALVIVFGLCACVTENTGNDKSNNSTVKPTESLTEETEPNQLVGAWCSEDVLWIFDDNGDLRVLYQGYFPNANPNNYSICEDTYFYSIDGKVLNICSGSRDNAELVYEKLIKFSGDNNLTLTDSYSNGEVVKLTRVKGSNDAEKVIIGTWMPFGYDSFRLNFGSNGYDAIEKLSFYNDGTFRIIAQWGDEFGEYKFLFDGEMLQMRVGGHGEFDYELFGDEFMLLKFSIYDGEMQFSYLLKKQS